MKGGLEPQNLLIAGIPRSGTTLVCSLINRLPNAVALVEPLDLTKLVQAPDERGRQQRLGAFLNAVRRLALQRRPMPGKAMGGDETNTFRSKPGGKRRSAITATVRPGVDKALSPNFLLAVKHPNAFSALLPELVGCFECCAIIRNPLAVLASWETLDLPLSQGRAPMAEAFDDGLRKRLNAIEGRIDRQIELLDWYYRTYAATLPAARIIRYEDIVETDGAALAPVVAAADLPRMLDGPLTSRNANPIYDNGPFISRCAEALFKLDGHACWSFYAKAEAAQVGMAMRDRRRTPAKPC